MSISLSALRNEVNKSQETIPLSSQVASAPSSTISIADLRAVSQAEHRKVSLRIGNVQAGNRVTHNEGYSTKGEVVSDKSQNVFVRFEETVRYFWKTNLNMKKVWKANGIVVPNHQTLLPETTSNESQSSSDTCLDNIKHQEEL